VEFVFENLKQHRAEGCGPVGSPTYYCFKKKQRLGTGKAFEKKY